MRILVIGGTRLVGRQIAAAALARGHDVTLFNRGQTDPAGLPGTTVLTGDRNTDLGALATGDWDATIDVCGYVHRQVRELLELLGERSGHYTFISTISVYPTDVPVSGFTESAPLLEPAWDDELTMAKYGELKVACEEVAAAYAKDRLLVIRPGYVVGPHDYTERFTHWIRMIAAGKPFEAPAATQPLQCVDGRDLGDFTIGCVERGVVDVFNVTAPQDPPTFAEVLDTIATTLGVELPDVAWRDASDDREDLPLSAEPAWWPLMRADLSRAVAAGLVWRPLTETIRDTAAFIDL
jgi:2'-hydroxyisoflavone reductase